MRAASLAMTVLLLVGCASDRQALDGFSRAYSGFLDAAALTDQAARMPVDHDSNYWKALKDAVNIRATNGFRFNAASTAIGAYQVQASPIMAVFSESIGSMDSCVAVLIESANRIKNDRARAQATETANHARELQASYAALVPLYQRRFELQLDVLQDMVADNGALSAIVSNRHGSEEIAKRVAESDERWKEAAVHWQKMKDTFSALKGQFDLKTYPSKWDSVSTAEAQLP